MSDPAASPAAGFVDVHCHVLPGVDDGARDLRESLAFLRQAAAAGTATIVATPHQHPGRYPNPAAALASAHERLGAAVAEARESGEILPEVLLGAEVHLDVGLRELVDAGERLRLAGGAYLLLELPEVFPLAAVERLVYELQLGGVVPLLAHPERIPQLLRQPDQLRRLVERGALGQATGSSVAGVFGAPCREATMGFIREGLVHVVASDAHDASRRTTDLTAARAALAEAFGDEVARAMLVDRPRAIVESRAFPADPPRQRAAAPPAGAWDRLRGWLGRG